MNILTQEDCEKILKRSVDVSTNFIGYNISKLSDNAVGFMGDHFRLIIEFSPKASDNENEIKQLSYFMKTLPQFNTNQLDYVRNSGIFKKEVLLYQNLLSEMQKISEFGPKCYFVTDSCIILEDLSLRGYRNLAKGDYLGSDLCKSMLKNLGKYHAATIVFEQERDLKLSDKFKSEIKEACFSFSEGEPRQKWCVTVTKCVSELIKIALGGGEDAEKVAKIYCDYIFQQMPEMIKPSSKFRNVLTHDDLWCNNMMFNANMDCLFVDFQLVRYTPPAFDLLVALYINLERKYLEENLSKLTELYYESLSDELKRHGLSVDQFLSKEEFDKTLKYYQIPAMIEAVMYGSHVFVSQHILDEIVSDFTKFNEFSFLNREKFVVKDYKENEQFRNRLNNVLLPLVDILNK